MREAIDAPVPVAETAVSEATPYRWAIVGGMVAGNGAMTLAALSLGLLLPAMAEDLRLSDLQQGWLGSSLRLGNVVLAVPAAIYLSRFSPVRMFSLSVFLAAVFTFLHGLAPSFLVLLLVRLVFGLSFTLMLPARTLLVQQWFPLRKVPLVNGVMVGFIGIAEAAAFMVTPVVLTLTGSWRATYHIYGLFAVATLLAWLLLGRERATPKLRAQIKSAPRLPYRAVLKHPDVWLVSLGALGTTFGLHTFATFWPTYMLETHQFSLTRSGFLFSLISIAMIPASMLTGFLASKVGHRRLILAGCGLLMAGGFLGMIGTTQMWALVLFGIMGGVASSFAPVAFSVPFEIPGIRPQEVAVGSAVIMTMMMVGGILGPVTAGAISEATGSLQRALLVCSFLPLTLVLFSLPLRERPAS